MLASHLAATVKTLTRFLSQEVIALRPRSPVGRLINVVTEPTVTEPPTHEVPKVIMVHFVVDSRHLVGGGSSWTSEGTA